MTITSYQERIYSLLVQIPSGRVCTYKDLSDATQSSPRAVGGALRTNPFAPEVPCHRCIATSGFVAGYKGDWEKAPSGQNQDMKLKLLADEGVLFDERGMLRDRMKLWHDFDITAGSTELEKCIKHHHRNREE